MPRIEPTIGRVVLYFPSDDDVYYGRIEGEKGKPLSAMIVWTNEDGTINLAVNDRYGNNHSRQNVRLIQDGEPKPERTKTNSYATWMAYQVGQAAKTEELQAKLQELPGTVVNRHILPDKPPIGGAV